MPKCNHCDGTGSLSKDVFKDLDCPHCDVALERVQLEGWLDHQGIQISAPEAWLIFSSGKVAALEQAAMLIESCIGTWHESDSEALQSAAEKIREAK